MTPTKGTVPLATEDGMTANVADTPVSMSTPWPWTGEVIR